MKSSLRILAAAIVVGLFSNCNNNNTGPNVSASLSGYLASTHIITDSSMLMPAIDAQDAEAFFVSTPGSMTPMLVDSVLVNGTEMEVDGNGVGYIAADLSLDMSSTCVWHVAGNGVIPSFTYNYPAAYPSVTGTVPDTLYKSQGITFHFTFSGADSVTISIASDVAGQPVIKAFSPASTSQSFSSSELAPLLTTPFLGQNIISVEAYKYTIQSFSGKSFGFYKACEHQYWWAIQ
jgi:hypothetical protein